MTAMVGKGTSENLDSIAQPIGIAMFALADVVYRYACEWLTMAPLARIGSSECRWFCC